MLSSRRSFLTSASAGLLMPLMPTSSLADIVAIADGAAQSSFTVVTAVQTGRPALALTFDDGPHPRHTPRLLDMLREHGAKATFFLIGQRVATWPELAARIVEEGHELGNHTWSHPFLNRRSDASVLREIDRTSNAIYRATGKAPVTFRPPYGAFTPRQQQMLHAERGLPTIMWSVDPLDWRRPGSSVVANRILRRAAPGAIVLAHDIHGSTVRAVPTVLDGLGQRGLETVTMSDLLGWPNWSNLRFRPRG